MRYLRHEAPHREQWVRPSELARRDGRCGKSLAPAAARRLALAEADSPVPDQTKDLPSVESREGERGEQQEGRGACSPTDHREWEGQLLERKLGSALPRVGASRPRATAPACPCLEYAGVRKAEPVASARARISVAKSRECIGAVCCFASAPGVGAGNPASPAPCYQRIVTAHSPSHSQFSPQPRRKSAKKHFAGQTSTARAERLVRALPRDWPQHTEAQRPPRPLRASDLAVFQITKSHRPPNR